MSTRPGRIPSAAPPVIDLSKVCTWAVTSVLCSGLGEEEGEEEEECHCKW